MEEVKKLHYDEAIRHSLEHEDEVRNQRTNWFLAFQGVLFAGVLTLFSTESANEDQKQLFLAIASVFGTFVSISFIHAAWRSDKAIEMLIACWNRFVGKNYDDYYPIMPITKEIIGEYGKSKQDQREKDLASRMGITFCDKVKNKFDFLMPYGFLPVAFFAIWMSILVDSIIKLFDTQICVWNCCCCCCCDFWSWLSQSWYFKAPLIIFGTIIVIWIICSLLKWCKKTPDSKPQIRITFNGCGKIAYQVLIDRFTGDSKIKQMEDERRKQEMKAGKKQLTPPPFTGGNFKILAERLSYIKKLGAEFLMLSPFFKTEHYHGYHCITDCNEIEPNFGTVQDLLDLIKKTKGYNMKLVADFVPNHCHENNPLFAARVNNNWFKTDPATGKVQGYAGLDELPVFNLDNPQARAYMIAQAKQLCAWGFDVLRIDHATGPSYGFLLALKQELANSYPDVKLIGEVVGKEDFTPSNPARYAKNNEDFGEQEAMQLEYVGVLHGVLDYEYYNIIKKALKFGENIKKSQWLRKTVEAHFARYPQNFELWLFIDNHDVDRIAHLCHGDMKKVQDLIDFTLSWKRPTTIYYGTEVGMMNKERFDRSYSYDDENLRECMDFQNMSKK